jgi:hypothetical protein
VTAVRWRFAALAIALWTAGCTAPPVHAGAGCATLSTDERGVREYPGTGAFVLEPPAPILEPGHVLTLRAWMENPDCQTFTYVDPAYPCHSDLLAVGEGALDFRAPSVNASRPRFLPACTGWWRPFELAPGERLEGEFRWDGSIRLWDHSAVERGEPWAERLFYAAAGAWPVRYGWSGPASYETQRWTVLNVVENDLNVGSGLHPDRCRDATGAALVTQASVTVSPAEAPLGEPVSVYVNYTVYTEAPGCFLVGGSPYVNAGQGPDLLVPRVGHVCGEPWPDLAYMETRAASTSASIRFEWDGSYACGGPRREVAPGLVELQFQTGGFGHGLLIDGRPYWPNATLTWHPRA